MLNMNVNVKYEFVLYLVEFVTTVVKVELHLQLVTETL